ncbi:MAG: glycine--tRNA ligase [Deltaproteobacteria bacterium CG11_big_fil_rev_8_21_14_0_20_45_16]|nr:MAG: glycine--tRNA ligase [Deltaproteobacteria bacterium CG11_big_fil_rev_8_21_14_0_20_45_16]
MAKLVSLSKRRGFIFQSSEVYGGLNSCYDYGPLGVVLKNTVKNIWLNSMTREHDNIEPLDSSILMHPKIWEASGHVSNFSDPLVDCKTCKARFRADQLKTATCARKPSLKASECGGEFTEPRNFNLMFKTFMGPLEDESAIVYLRPETAQGIYVNFLNVMTSCRHKIPFGIAQIGKAFRNEITPGNFIFRMREFEQMEMQYFVKPGTDMDAFEEWKEKRIQWHLKLGLKKEKLRFHEHGPNELAHYAKAAFDIEYEFPFGWQEIEGVHHRSNFDLSQHEKFSGKRLSVFDQETRETYVPYIIETSVGCDRATLTLLADAYDEETVAAKDGEEAGPRTVLRFARHIAPYKIAIFPLMKKEPLMEKAQKIFADLRKTWAVEFDEVGSIGKRYRRVDEIGTPFALTVDFEDGVTIRDRDTMTQVRIDDSKIRDFFEKEFLRV